MRTLKFPLAVVMLGAAVLLSACVPPPEPAPPAGWSQVVLTRDGGDVTDVSLPGPTQVKVSSPASNTDSNSRSLLWANTAPVAVDNAACLTVGRQPLPTQTGVALRVASNGKGGYRAITVQNNVWGTDQVFNVHLWDTSFADPNTAHLASVMMATAVPGNVVRRVCARTTGRILEFKVWPAGHAEPAWGSPKFSHRVELPAAWVYPGRAGLYAGHVAPGRTVSLSDVSFGAPTRATKAAALPGS